MNKLNVYPTYDLAKDKTMNLTEFWDEKENLTISWKESLIGIQKEIMNVY